VRRPSFVRGTLIVTRGLLPATSRPYTLFRSRHNSRLHPTARHVASPEIIIPTWMLNRSFRAAGEPPSRYADCGVSVSIPTELERSVA
jgi:hypothetical protein